jgi:hypothetical protein
MEIDRMIVICWMIILIILFAPLLISSIGADIREYKINKQKKKKEGKEKWKQS